MPDYENIHATLINIKQKGVLLLGKSNSGKSDLALRLIYQYGAKLVADDVVCLKIKNNRLYGSSPQNICGLIEVRGLGIMQMKYQKESRIDLVAYLSDEAKVERMPKKQTKNILGLAIDKIDLYAKQASASEKILAALSGNIVITEAE